VIVEQLLGFCGSIQVAQSVDAASYGAHEEEWITFAIDQLCGPGVVSHGFAGSAESLHQVAKLDAASNLAIPVADPAMRSDAANE
jgi:hypothetical protein